jgi:hypothetical protein
MRSALVIGNGVDFVHDHSFDVAQNCAALSRGKQNVEGLRRGDQDMRRTLQHGAAFVCERVTGPNGSTNLRHQQAALACHLKDLAKWDFQVLLDVVAESLQRGDVKNFCPIAEVAFQCFAHQAIDAGEKCRQCLARAGGGGDQSGASGKNMGPAQLLGLGRRAEFLGKPFGN